MKSSVSGPERGSRAALHPLFLLLTILVVLALLAWIAAGLLTGEAEFKTTSAYLPIDGVGKGKIAAFVLTFGVLVTAFVVLARFTLPPFFRDKADQHTK
jgi:TRAP-type C4-dicarboxylate transport system permease small subunit